MIYLDDDMLCTQCGDMVPMSDLVDGLCADCIHENGLVSEYLEDQPEWIEKLPIWGTIFSS